MFSNKFISYFIILIQFIGAIQIVDAQKSSGNLIDYVNPFVGTGGHGHTFPGAAYPFGMMQLSPDTRLEGWDGCSGYHYSDTLVYGFSHTHLSGTGVPDYCDVLFMPGTGDVHFNNGSDGKEGYRSAFIKSKESASPGYYKVFLEKYKIQVELTVGKRTGIHHYQFPSSAGQWVLVDLKHRDPLIAAGFSKYKENELAGYRISKNIKSEFNEFNFKKLMQGTQKTWNEFLSRIQVEDKKKDEKVIFYTALYHNLIHPSLFQDVDGRYRGMDLKIHETTLEDHYTVFSLWDTYRSTHPLYQLIYPEYNSKFIRNFLRQYQECGHLPVWELAGNETWCMIGNHAIPVIANAFAHKKFDFDTALAKEAVTNSILNGTNSGMKFMKKGFIAANDESESVSKTIENSVDFGAARSMGCLQATPYHPEVYKNVYNPQTGFFQAKLNNSFVVPFNPKEVNHHYTEANAYQYLFGAHHDLTGLMNLFLLSDFKQKREEIFRRRLDSLFMTESDMSGRLLPDVTGLIGQYAHGNEPSHHMAYLYDLCAPEQGQQMIEKIKKEFYKNAPDGLIGNEDCGQMSSWYVFSALGFYPVNPFDAHYYLGYPSFEKVMIAVPNQQKISISTTQIQGFNQVSGFKLNGKNNSIRFKVQPGDQLEIIFGNTKIPPVTFKDSTNIRSSDYVIKPFVKNGNRVFNDSTTVVLSSLQKYPIAYTLDTASKNLSFFNDKIVLKEKTKLFFRQRVVGQKEDWLISDFSPKPKGMKLHLQSPVADHYTAGGSDALIDGLTGSDDYRDGLWQGIQGKDLKLNLEFENLRSLKHIGIRFIQDQPSWILMPDEVEFSCSIDGIDYKILDVVKTKTSKRNEQRIIEEFSVNPNSSAPAGTACKYLWIRAKNPGKLPEWHRGAGGDSWLFADEIILE